MREGNCPSSEMLFRSVFERAGIGMAVLDPDGRLLRVNPALCQILGYTAEELTAMDFKALTYPEDVEADVEQFNRILAGEIDHYAMEKRYLARNGSVVPGRLNVSVVRDGSGRPTYFIGQLEDVSEQKETERRLRRLAHRDVLTGLASRALFYERVREATDRLEADPGRVFAVLYLDLDRFKLINDSLGHAAGDELLKTAAERLRKCLARLAEEANGPPPTIGRMGGDEFTVLLPETGAAGGREAAEAVIEAFQAEHRLQDKRVTASASVGVTIGEPGVEHERLIRNADTAMYHAKGLGRGRYTVFDQSMQEAARERLQLETDLRRGFEQGELSMLYQPIFSLNSGRVAGFEALLRWEHPTRGRVDPSEFVPLAEETGLIQPIGHWTIERACRDLAAWRAQGSSSLLVCVNASPGQLQSCGFAEVVDAVIRQTELDPGALQLEVAEETLFCAAAKATFEALIDRGVGFSLDNFGRGFSSLGMVHRLPLSGLKIDRWLLRQASGCREHSAIIHTLVTLGHNLGRSVVAEGIETHEQLALAQGCGCDLGQGFLLSEPMEADEVPRFLSAATALEPSMP